MRHIKAELTQEKGFKHAEDEFIEAIIYHRMWSSAVCWKTIGAVIEGLKNLKYKKDKLRTLKDIIQIHYFLQIKNTLVKERSNTIIFGLE